MKRIVLSMALMSLCAFGAFAQSWSKDLEKAAKKGDVEAQLTVGNAYLNGDGVKQNAKKAVKWLFMAAQAGNTEAVKSMCTFYSKELEEVAATGSVDAQFALANFYAEGNGVKQNSEMAYNLYGDAAVQGHKEAKTKLLGQYNPGLEKLAAAGDVDAQFALANFYAEGNGVKQNSEIAYNLYGDAAVQGHKEAKTKLLGQYNPGLEKLAAAGDVDAQFALANFYAEGNGVEKNSEKALSLYGDAAAQGHQEAKPKVLGSYNPGIVKLAKAGDLDAATEVADYLFNGKGGATKNEADAATYYSIACKAGNKAAEKKLVTMYNAYLTGKGVPQNEELGNLWLAQAAAAGIEEAKQKFYSTDTRYLVQSAKNGDFEAKKALAKFRGGWWYLHTIDACKNSEQCRELFKEYDANKMTVVYTDSVLPDYRLYGDDALVNWAFYLPHDMVQSKNFDLDDVDVKNVKIYSPNVACFLIWKQCGSEQTRHALVKRLMNEFNHELAKNLYDQSYFQKDYESYSIGEFDGRKIVGFTGLDNVVMINGMKRESEVPKSEELTMLVDSMPEFAINPDAVRVIRNYTIWDRYGEKITASYDIFYLPGMVVCGPNSFLRHYEYGSGTPYDFTFDCFSYGKKLDKIGTKAFTLQTKKPIHGFGIDVQDADITEWAYFQYNMRTDYFSPEYRYSLGCATIDGQIVPVYSFNHNYSFEVLEYKIEGKDGAMCKMKVRALGSFMCPYTLEVKGDSVSIVENVIPETEYVTDAGDAYYEAVKYPFTMPDGSTQLFNIPKDHANSYELSYLKPDGTLKRYLISSWVQLDLKKLREELSPEYIEALIKETSESYCVDTAVKLKYGMLENEYEANKNALAKAENDAKWEDFWARMTKEYGKAQVNMLRNSKTVLIKGLDIRLLDAYNWFVYNEFNNNIGAVNPYKSHADGSSVYILERMSSETYIYTRNYKIYDWTIYKD